ncbi:MAG: DNA polymerase III subunit delta [Halothiobacillaceae bacterium]
MKLRPEQLRAQLARELGSLYLLTGDEPLLVEEARDAILDAARARDFSERMQLIVEPGFAWSRLQEAAGNRSLFSERRIVDLRIPSGKPGKEGGEALTRFVQMLGPDLCAVVTLPRLDQQARKAKWFRTLEGCGIHLAFWPVESGALPGWVAHRARAHDLQLEPDAARFLAERAEGNLLAARQEIEKLALLLPPGPVSLRSVVAAVTDNARFSVFDLGEAIVAGDVARVQRTLHGLRAEGVEIVLALWAVTREVRILARASDSGDLAEALQAAGVPPPRRRPYGAAVRRHQAGFWRALLGACGQVDRAVKGLHPGDPWIGLERLSLCAAGKNMDMHF